MRTRSDPLLRFAVLRAFVWAAAAALGGAWTPALGLALAAVGSVEVGFALKRRIDPLRRQVIELAEREEGLQRGMPLDLDEASALVRRARERLDSIRGLAERERDELFTVLEASFEGILVLGRDDRVERLNDAARHLVGAEVEPVGRPLEEVVRHHELRRFVDLLAEGRRPDPIRIDLPDGSRTRSLEVSGGLSGAGDGRRTVIALRDLTALQHLERVRSDFVANVTHEMRSPLASILGYAETLRDLSDASPEERDGFVDRILRNARRLEDIIRDLIQLSRLEQAAAAELAEVDVGELVREVASAFEDTAGAKKIALEVDVGRLPRVLQLDRDLVRQVLVNLVENAVKYTPEGGRVQVGGRLEGGELHLSVRDTGPGISREHQERIFERFYRVDTARSRALGGTGLGLAIAKHSAALHGGSVRLESELGRGSLFELVIPARDLAR